MTRCRGGLVVGRWLKWALIATSLCATGCAVGIGAGAAVVVVGAGVLASTCYDRVIVTVMDQATGTNLCDAKVTFTEGGSVTEASSCHQAYLSLMAREIAAPWLGGAAS